MKEKEIICTGSLYSPYSPRSIGPRYFAFDGRTPNAVLDILLQNMLPNGTKIEVRIRILDED